MSLSNSANTSNSSTLRAAAFAATTVAAVGALTFHQDVVKISDCFDERTKINHNFTSLIKNDYYAPTTRNNCNNHDDDNNKNTPSSDFFSSHNKCPSTSTTASLSPSPPLTTTTATTTTLHLNNIKAQLESLLGVFFEFERTSLSIPLTSTSNNSKHLFDIQSNNIRVLKEPAVHTSAHATWDRSSKNTLQNMKGSHPRYYDVSVRALKGNRLSMEDEYFVSNGGRFAAVFDGHGGGGVSNFLRATLYDKINDYLNSNGLKHDRNSFSPKKNEKHLCSTSPSNQYKQQQQHHHQLSLQTTISAIKHAFHDVEDQVLNNKKLQFQGSTAVAVMLHEDFSTGNRTLVSANVGDSRAVLSREGQAIELTRDHKPNDEDEKKRITSFGESIEWDHYSGVYRVRNLSLSRAIGDAFAKPIVSGEVEIKTFPIHDTKEHKNERDGSYTGANTKDEFVVLASDGLWDVMTSQDCVNFIHKRIQALASNSKKLSVVEAERQKYAHRKNMSRFVANEALRRGSGDNVCVIIIWLHDLSCDGSA
eukprot:CAMPEP_0184859114 /NCGR_PEP_ID=MMETSP0580-20130426/4147_1 /TAXON_ID=1118495 /ORGANISM="Dactyliosolen fragilissimus" /LENGTH=533 /DNA_ID=CAMNT_0027355585 /DNA_START=515 /DNA_END=2116 /DNA_ORIENTATION=-